MRCQNISIPMDMILIKKKLKLKNRLDQNNEIKQINKKLKFSYNEKIFLNCNTFIICLPTPINNNNIPDLNILKKVT